MYILLQDIYSILYTVMSPGYLCSAFIELGNRPAKPSKGMQHVRRADTNIVGIQFSILKKSCGLHTGDAVICNNRNCTAALSHLSKLSPLPGREEKVPQSWEYWFCKLRWTIRRYCQLLHWVVAICSIHWKKIVELIDSLCKDGN